MSSNKQTQSSSGKLGSEFALRSSMLGMDTSHIDEKIEFCHPSLLLSARRYQCGMFFYSLGTYRLGYREHNRIRVNDDPNIRAIYLVEDDLTIQGH
ncbi:hypothetical protein ACTXT7_015843 [Hymenolepis weldensis]